MNEIESQARSAVIEDAKRPSDLGGVWACAPNFFLDRGKNVHFKVSQSRVFLSMTQAA